ncbi:hypothetical protein HK107_02390 [Parvularcula sp. ZS-1/3]|uniref:Uncharacterized protein n=1 Tax=Parvularcula mediterranea TaxID=2732508 RepID=A0A7Y3W472_9PROT|nr:hypothetical protein [Parvularcula mediterranea]NNU15173.1 hypothetical protein [Parvularcula mediterranea]
MTDRLKEIWTGFTRTTGANLTTREMSAMARPSVSRRLEESFDTDAALAAGKADESDAVQAAFAALHAEIEQKGKRASRRRRGPEAQTSFSAEADVTAPSGLDERLLADLKFTEARVRRSGSDYLNYARTKQEAWQKGRRKKFLGIF